MAISINPPPAFKQPFEELVRRDASDLHFIPGEPPTFRQRGRVERTEDDPLTDEDVRILAVECFGEEELARIGAEVSVLRGVCEVQAGDEDPHPDNPAGTIRRVVVVVGRSQGHYTVAARLIPSRIFTLEQLGVPRSVVEAATAPARPGLVVFSGLMGSGMNTTAAAVVDHINANRSVLIHVIGDPVEYVFEPKQALILHREVGADVPDVVSAIGGAIEQNADVIFVQYLRGAEELEACLTAAQNRQVITMIHARSVESALERMVRMYPPDVQAICRSALADTLCCLVNQSLLPKASGKGRVAAYGVLAPNREMRAAIAEGRDPFGAQQRPGEGEPPLPEGSWTKQAHIAQLAKDGIISEETAAKALERA